MAVELPTTIRERLDQFSGREWLLPILQDWLQNGDEQIFLLTGWAGTGKSMIMGWLATAGDDPEAHPLRKGINSQITAVHFCLANDSSSFTPLGFADHVANQLLHHVVGFDEALTKALEPHGVKIEVHQTIGYVEEGAVVIGVEIDNLNLAGLTDTDSFDISFVQPLVQLYQNGYDQPMLILVDALDEAWSGNERGQELVQSLSKLEGLPAQVKILVSSRPDPRVTMFFEDSARAFDLVKDAPDVTDIYDFAKEWLLHRQEWAEDVAQQVARRIESAAEGIFLYAYMVLRDEVPNWKSWEDDMALELPSGLSGLYNSFFKRELGSDRKRWFKELKPLLGLIAVAQGEGVALEKLQQLLERDPSYELEICQQYLTGEFPDGPFRLFHQSLAEFLLQDRKNNKRHRIEAKEMHQHFANVYQPETDWGKLDAYDIHYLPYHLAGAGRQSDLEQLLLTFRYLQAKLEKSNVSELVNDFDNLATKDRQDPVQLVQRALQLSARVLAEDKQQMAGQLVSRLKSFAQPDLQSLVRKAEGWHSVPWLRPLKATLTPPGGPLRQILSGHSDAIHDLSFLSDGNYIISASEDGEVRIWDLGQAATPSKILHLENHCIPFGILPDKDQKRLFIAEGSYQQIVGSSDNTISVWDIETEKKLRCFGEHKWPILSICILPDAKTIVSASWDKTVKVWDIESGQLIWSLKKHLGRVNDITLVPGRNQLISASWDKTLILWDLATGTQVLTLEGHDAEVNTVVATPDGKHVISGSSDGSIRVWSLETGQILRVIDEHDGAVTALAVTPDGKRIFSGSTDKTIKIWNIISGKPLGTLSGHISPVSSIEISEDGTQAVSGSKNGTIIIWDLSADISSFYMDKHLNIVTGLSVKDDEAISISADESIKLWNWQNGKLLKTFTGYYEPSAFFEDKSLRELQISFLPQNMALGVKITDDWMVFTAFGEQISVWGSWFSADERFVLTPPDHKQELASALCWDERNKRLWVAWGVPRFASADTTVFLTTWDIFTEKMRRWEISHNYEWITCLVPLSRANRCICGTALHPSFKAWTGNELKYTIKIFALDEGKSVATFEGHSAKVCALASTEDDRILLSSSYDGTLRVWDMETCSELRRLSGHQDTVTKIVPIPGGSYFLTASYDQSVKLWRLSDWSIIASFNVESPILSCAVSQDGTTVIIGEASGQVHFLRFEIP